MNIPDKERELFPVSRLTTHAFAGIVVLHEVYDGADVFRHRLNAPFLSAGEWVQYSWFAELILELEGQKRHFMACQENYRSLFPQVFEVISG